MSNIKQMIQHRLNELALIELQKEEDILINTDSTLVTISIRVPKDLVKQIDIIANKLQLSRSDIIRSFLTSSVTEGFKGLDMSVEEVLELMGYLEQDDIERKNKIALAEQVAKLEAKEND